MPVHKVSRSCSPKDSETNPRLNDKDVVKQQSTALQKKRERYHSQRRKPAASEKIVSGEKSISVIKSITSPCQDHPLGNKGFKTPFTMIYLIYT